MATGTYYPAVDDFSVTLSNAPGTAGTSFQLSSTTGLPANVLDGTYSILVTAITDSTYNTNSESRERLVLTISSGTTFTAVRSFGSDTALDLAIGDHIEIRTASSQLNDMQNALIAGTTDINTAVLDCTSLDIGSTAVCTAINNTSSMSDASATTLATSGSIKSYVDTAVTGLLDYKGGYDASGDPSGSALKGDMYTVTVAGTGAASYWSTTLDIGDAIIAEVDSPSTEADWTVVQSNIDLDVVDINGGTIDGTTIGGTTPAAGTFNGLTVSTGDLTVTAGDITAGGDLAVGDNTTGTTIDINATSASNGAIDFTEAAGIRWRLFKNSSGAFLLNRYNASGVFQDVPFKIDSAGDVDITNDLTVTAGEISTIRTFTNNGSNTAPTHTFTTDTDTGMYRAGSDILAFTTGGTEALTIDSSQNVTIPTGDLTVTAGNLDVGGNIEFNDFFYLPASTTRFINASGQLTVLSSHHAVDTAGGAATDDLDTIAGGTRDGQIVVLRPASSSRDVTVKHATGNIRLEGNADWTWANTDCRLGLMFSGSNWFEIFRADT